VSKGRIGAAKASFEGQFAAGRRHDNGCAVATDSAFEMNPTLPDSTASLTIAVALEVIATSFLKQSAQFTNLVPSVLTLVFYGATFYVPVVFTQNYIPVGIAYAIWSGLGIVLISTGWIFRLQPVA
jgi:multidrug transporter EmrE-like cation transporter